MRETVAHSPMLVAAAGEDEVDGAGGGAGGSAAGGSPIVTVRTFFPETWLWDIFETG